MDGSMMVLVTATSFVGTHFVLSHPLRRPLVRVMGEGGFLALYSAIAFLTLGASVWAFREAPMTEPLWPVGDGLWVVATLIMLIASILLMGSLIRNPALPGAAASAAGAEAHGVYAITRHPMMWSFALWGVAHILVMSITKNIILSAAIIVLALVGARFQDAKKLSLDPRGWTLWEGRTSYLPFAAIAEGRARLGGLGAHALGGGLVLWLAATWAHMPLAGWPAGIWRWLI